MESALAPLLWFAGIVAAIPLVLWLVRRSPVGAALASGPMRTVSQLPLAGSQRIVTVEVGSGADRVWLVLGVGPQGVRTLHVMPPQAEPASALKGPAHAR